MVASLLGRVNDPAELALQPVDHRTEAAGIDEIVVGLAIEISDGILKHLELSRHGRIIRTSVRYVHACPVNLYSLRCSRGPPDAPPAPYFTARPSTSSLHRPLTPPKPP